MSNTNTKCRDHCCNAVAVQCEDFGATGCIFYGPGIKTVKLAARKGGLVNARHKRLKKAGSHE